MRVNRGKKSPYSRMYLVTPAVYEKLKKCIDETDASEINKINQTEDTSDQSSSNETIRSVAREEFNPSMITFSTTNDQNTNNSQNLNQSTSHPNSSTNQQNNIQSALQNFAFQPVSRIQPIANISGVNASTSHNLTSQPVSIIPTLASIPEADESADISFNPQFYSTRNIDDDVRTPPKRRYSNQPNSTQKSKKKIPTPNFQLDESYEPLPGPSRQQNSLFVNKKNIQLNRHESQNIPVQPPQLVNQRLLVHPKDSDITWLEQSNQGVSVNNDASSAAMDATGITQNYSIPNISVNDQISFGGDTTHSNNLSSSVKHVNTKPRYDVRRVLNTSNIAQRTRFKKKNICASILPLKGCKTKVQFYGDDNSLRIFDHPPLIGKRFTCPVCLKKYSSIYTIKRHMETIHPDTIPPIHQRDDSLPMYEEIPKPNWVKMGKRKSEQINLTQNNNKKFTRRMTVGLKRDVRQANLDNTTTAQPRRQNPRTFKNWKIYNKK